MKIKLRPFVAIIGLSVPIVFILGLAIFIAINPEVLDFIEYGSLFAFNIEGIQVRFIISLFCYFLVGLLIIIFGYGLMRLLPKSATNIVGSIIYMVTGFLWTSLAFFHQRHNSDSVIVYLIIASILIIVGSGLAQLFISNDLDKLIKNKFIKSYVMISGTLFLIEFVVCIYVPEFPISLPIISVLVFVFNFGVIAYNLSKDSDFIQNES